MDLYRYMSFEEFMTLVTFRTLHFVDPTRWDDSYEGCAYRMMADETFRNSFFSDLYDKSTATDLFVRAAGMLSNYCHFIYISGNWYGQCWTHSESESDAFWRIYSYDKKSIRVKSSVEKMTALFNLKYKCYDKKVLYDNAANREDVVKKQLDAMIEEKNAVEPFFHKRTAFSHEKEYRFLITPLTDEQGNECPYPNMVGIVVQMALLTLNIINKETPIVDKETAISAINQAIEKTVPKRVSSMHSDINVNIENVSDLVQDVLVNPLAENWYVSLVNKVCKDNNIHCSGKSTLYNPVI